MSHAVLPTGEDTVANRFMSLGLLRKTHAVLLSRGRTLGWSDGLLTDVEDFVRRGSASGAIIDSDEDRWAIQSLLDYWVATLDRAGRTAPESTLADFDPALSPELDDSLCPYVGLEAFQTKNHTLFFGRTQLIEEALERLRDSRVLCVVGPSGSGKSSIMLAGLLPALRAGKLPGSADWHYYPRLVPGPDPLDSLARLVCPRGQIPDDWVATHTALMRRDPRHLAGILNARERSCVLTIDQFEELFTLCTDEDDRAAFAANIASVIGAPDARHTVILTLRSDFEPQLILLRDLYKPLENALLRVTPLSGSELRAAIEEPTKAVGLKFEDGVVDHLVEDILGEPAGLPLLQFTLLKLWENRSRDRITLEAYRRLGGGRLALARAADEFWQSLIPQDQSTARRILLQLVRPGSGLEFTSRRIRREELYRRGEAAERIDRVLEKLIKARLVRVTEGASPPDDRIEVAHEALVRNWPLLVEWLAAERVALKHRLELSSRAHAWETRGRDASWLLQGAMVDEAEKLEDLDILEREFIDRSRRTQTRRRRLRLGYIYGALATLLLTAIVGYRYKLQRAAHEQLESQQRDTKSALAALAALRNLETDPELSLLLALESVSRRRAVTDAVRPESEEALYRAAEASRVRLILQGHKDLALRTAYSPDGTRIAVSGWGTVQVLDAATGRQLLSFKPHKNEIDGLAFSPDGKRLATGSRDMTAKVWDLTTNQEVFRATSTNSVFGVAFSPDGQSLLTGGAAANATLWDLRTGKASRDLPFSTGYISSVAFSPNGQRVVVAGDYGNAIVWDVSSGMQVQNLNADGSRVRWAAFLPDNRRLVTASEDGGARIWDVAAGRLLDRFEHTGQLCGGVVSADGTTLMTSADNGRTLWNLSSRRQLETIPHSGGILCASISPDLKTIVLGDSTGSVLSVRDAISDVQMFSHTQVDSVRVYGVDYSPDGLLLATAGTDLVHIWDAISGKRIRTLRGHVDEVMAVRFSPDGFSLLTGSTDGSTILWGVASGEQLYKFTSSGPVYSVAFSPDGRRFSSGERGRATLWDISTRQALLTFEQPGSVFGVAFSPDGDRLVTGDTDAGGKVRVWNTTTGSRLDSLRHPDGVYGVAFDHSGQRIATASWDGNVRIWKAPFRNGNSVVLAGHTGGVMSVVFSRDDAMLVSTGYDRKVISWRLDSDAAVESRTFAGHNAPVYGAALSPNNSSIASASFDGSVRVWDVSQHAGPVSTVISGDGVQALAFSPNGRQLATAGNLSPVALYDAESGARLKVLAEYGFTVNPRTIAFDPANGARVAVARHDSVMVYDLRSDARTVICCHKGDVVSLAFSHDGHSIATSSEDSTARVWDGRSGKLVRSLAGHHDRVSMVDFSPSDDTIATASADGTVKLWQRSSGALIRTFQYSAEDKVNAIAFGRNGRVLAAGGSDGFVRIWDVTTAKLVLAIAAHNAYVTDLAFDATGRRIATSSDDGTARLWDASSGRQLLSLAFPPRVNTVAFSPGGDKLLVGSTQGSTMHIVDFGSLVARALTSATRPLSRSECERYLQETNCSEVVHSVVTARALARSGDTDSAAVIFAEAARKAVATGLTHDSAASFLDAEGRALGNMGDYESSLASFRAARNLDPASRLDPDRAAERASVGILLARADGNARRGQIADAREYLERAWHADSAKVGPEQWNTLCWYGALHAHAAEVIEACDRGVTSSKGAGYIRDSRGVARAQLGNFAGAKEDFAAFLKSGDVTSLRERQLREGWIRALNASRNPFNSSLLKKLLAE